MHTIVSSYTKSELESKYLNSNDSNGHKFFSHILDSIKRSNVFYEQPSGKRDKMVFACLILDSYLNLSTNRLMLHTALGNGYSFPKLGIFGSHLLHAWPENENELIGRFTDTRRLDFSQLANDDSSTKYKALNTGIGAFLHELGHALKLGKFNNVSDFFVFEAYF